MKKKLLVFCTVAIAISVAAYGLIDFGSIERNKEDNAKTETSYNKDFKVFDDFIYEIGPRFSPIRKSELLKLRSFNDIIGSEHSNRITKYNTVDIIVMQDDERTSNRVNGSNNEFTDEQLSFFESLDYSTNFVVWAEYEGRNPETGNLENEHWTPYFTVVPENQAVCKPGIEALKKFLKEASQATRNESNVVPEQLQPAKLYFTVSRQGEIINLRLDRTSNYPAVDEKMKELIKSTAGLWTPATNTIGELVDQELVVSFGLMGC